MQNEWIRADRFRPESGKEVYASIRGVGIRVAEYHDKKFGGGGYFQWQENASEDYYEDDLSLIAWRDLPEDYDWGCE